MKKLGIDWDTIKKQEELSFIRYALCHGYEDPEELARKQILFMQQRQATIDSVSEVEDSRLEFDFLGPPIRSIIDANRKAAIRYSKRLVSDLLNFIVENKAYYQINWKHLEDNARLFGIDDASLSDCILRYLYTIPIIMLYTPDIQAFVQSIPNNVPRVVISRNLNQLMEIVLIPLIINLIFPNGIIKYIIDWDEISATDLDKATDLIINVAKHYLGKKSVRFDTDEVLIKPTKLTTSFGLAIYYGSLCYPTQVRGI